MLSRFAEPSALEKENKLIQMHAQNTKKAERKCARIVKDYLRETGQSDKFEEWSTTALNSMLSNMYLALRKPDGGMYKCTSLTAFRFSLNRYLKSIPRNIDIIKGSEFIEANSSFQAALAELKRNGMGGITYYAELKPDDLKLIYSSPRGSIRHSALFWTPRM